MLSTLLSEVQQIPLLTGGYEIGLNWIGKFARVIIEGVGNIGLGIILFTLVLKAITLPFDIYQRVKMRKQNLIMKQMQPELEKLQKQYANDKATYNQKMLELQKKNGFSIFGACLPTILSLVILIVAFQGFRTYSQYANLKTFKEMSEAYNSAILSESVDGVDYRLSRGEDGSFTLLWKEGEEEKSSPIRFESGKTLKEAGIETADGIDYTMQLTSGRDENDLSAYEITVTSEDKALGYHYIATTTRTERTYFIRNTELLLSREGARERIQAIKEESLMDDDTGNDITTDEGACYLYVVEIGSNAAADCFHDKAHSPSFLWVKNVWYPDVSYNHPIPNYSTFSSQLNKEVTFPDELDENGKPVERELTSVLNEDGYNYLTRSLAREKEQANGYFILIILSIGFMILSQFISMRSSKESNKYQTVDGQGAMTQKMMLFIMPVIYAVFAFLYSAAFSIYMTMSSIISLLIMVFSNLILDRVFKKKEEEAFVAEHTRVLPWMQNKEQGSSQKDGKSGKNNQNTKNGVKNSGNQSDKKRKK